MNCACSGVGWVSACESFREKWEGKILDNAAAR